MTKAVPPTSRKDSAAKPPVSPAKPRSRSVKSAASPPAVAPVAELLAPLMERLSAVEEKITAGFSTMVTAVQAQQAAPAPEHADGSGLTETFLPLVADLIRRGLIEHLTPITAALKRLEERVGFVSNRLKHPPGRQERQKPWRHDQPSRSQPRRHGAPRPGPGQSWTTPSAASVQGHFAPRPLRNEDDHPPRGDEDE